MKTTRLILLLAGATLLVAGCNKQNPFGGKYSRSAGEPIVFGIGTKSMETRTEYGDVNTVGGKKVQELRWVQDDMIRIYSPETTRLQGNQPQQWADYTVNPLSTDPNKGTLSNVQQYGLAWGTSGTYHFYSVYPSPETDEGNVPEAGTSGVFNLTVPATQLVADEMEYAFMTAATEVTTTEDDNAVELDFYPAFTAFQFDLVADEDDVTLESFTLSSTGTAITGAFEAKWHDDADNLLAKPVFTCTGTGKKVTIADLGDEAVIGKTTPFSFKVFCLPQDLSGLKIAFTIRKSGATATETRSLTLNKADGSPVTFAGGKIHKISGTLQASYNFKYITLTGEPVEWVAVMDKQSSDHTPQASQFNVKGDGVQNVYDLHHNAQGKPLRQTWVLGANTATVTFKVFSPAGGVWEILPLGATDKFTVTVTSDATSTAVPSGATYDSTAGTWYGHIESREEENEGHRATKVTITITPNGAAAGDQLWFKTFVYADPQNSEPRSGNKYSLDSETQLYDMRGFHYFRIDDPLSD